MTSDLLAKLSLGSLSTVTVPENALPQSALMALKNASCDGIDGTSDRARADTNKRPESTTRIGDFMAGVHAERLSEFQDTLVSSFSVMPVNVFA